MTILAAGCAGATSWPEALETIVAILVGATVMIWLLKD